MKIQPKNWSNHQHYKNRKPPWIKLHRDLLDDYDFHCLPLASKALAPCLWLLASEYEDGIIDTTAEKIAFRVRMTVGELFDALSGLNEKGFLSCYHDDSNLLADCKQHAITEREVEIEGEKERECRKNETPKKNAPRMLCAYDPHAEGNAPFLTFPFLSLPIQFSSSKEFSEAWVEWENFRTGIKKKLTKESVKKQIATLSTLSVPDAVATINKSISAGYQGLFPTKDKATAEAIPQTKPDLSRFVNTLKEHGAYDD